MPAVARRPRRWRGVPAAPAAVLRCPRPAAAPAAAPACAARAAAAAAPAPAAGASRRVCGWAPRTRAAAAAAAAGTASTAASRGRAAAARRCCRLAAVDTAALCAVWCAVWCRSGALGARAPPGAAGAAAAILARVACAFAEALRSFDCCLARVRLTCGSVLGGGRLVLLPGGDHRVWRCATRTLRRQARRRWQLAADVRTGVCWMSCWWWPAV
jgi:hypothetical protein